MNRENDSTGYCALNTETSFNSTVKAFLLSFFIAALVSAASAQGRTCTITIINTENKAVVLTAEIADNDYLRSKGLMFRKQLDKNRGMIFVYQTEEYLTFWMKNTYLPLSIAFIGANGTINDIHDMRPLDTSVLYPSKSPARFALEVNQGWFKDNKIVPGCKITLHGCLGQ